MAQPEIAAAPAVDMATRLGQVRMPNPVFTASGCAAAGRELDQFFDVADLGGIVTKSVMPTGRSSRRPPPRPPPSVCRRTSDLVRCPAALRAS